MFARRSLIFASAWIVVFLAAAYDAAYAWTYQASFLQWEMNPFALWTVQEFGLGVLLFLKLLGLGFAAALASYCKVRRRGSEQLITAAASCAYAALVIHYLFVHPQPASQALLVCLR